MEIGSLFTGAAGLDAALLSVFGGCVAWHCESDPAASRLLANRFPDIPNLRDIAAVDWSGVPPVEVLCGGFPCQDMSPAGLRAGMGAGTRSGLWVHMADAIAALNPRIVVVENVRGILSARAHRTVIADDEYRPGDLESDAATVGDHPDDTLRAAGAVLGDLADLGFDAEWTTVSASAVGAPHRRERWFCIAYRPGDDLAAYPGLVQRTHLVPAGLDLLPTPRATDCFGPGEHGDGGMDLRTTVIAKEHLWHRYEPALARWSQLTTRAAPNATEPNTRGGRRLKAAFSEWMMGWPEGWVTESDLSRNDQLRIIGNGVVPQQATAALVWLLHLIREDSHHGVRPRMLVP